MDARISITAGTRLADPMPVMPRRVYVAATFAAVVISPSHHRP